MSCLQLTATWLFCIGRKCALRQRFLCMHPFDSAGVWQLACGVLPHSLLPPHPLQGKGRKEAGPGAAGEPPLSEEELREQQKRRMLFGQSWPAAAPKAPPPPPPPQQQQPGGGSGAPLSPAQTAGGGEAAAGGPDSAGISPRGSDHAESEAAAPGEIYSSLSAAASAAGPLVGGPFGSRLSSLDLPAPPLHPEDSDGMGPSSSSGRGAAAADPAAAALLGGPPGGSGGSRQGLTTPRWAKSLASGAKKGLAKAKEALRESLQE